MGELINKILEITEKDILEVFGETGSGKTTFAIEVLKEAIEQKMKVIFIDTERNLLEKDVKNIPHLNYVYAPSLNDLLSALDKVLTSKTHYDVLVVDSIGLPILGWFAKLKLNEKGNALLKMQQILYDLKHYAYEHNTAILITNQPESRWMKPPDHDLRPFGDKAMFFIKELWKTYKILSNPTRTVCKFVAWRSRRWGRNREILTLEIFEEDSQKEVIIKWHI